MSSSRPEVAPAAMRKVVLALGTNLGDGPATLRSAIAALAQSPGLLLLAESPFYQTVPVGGPADQPQYLNAVALFQSALSARDILRLGLAIETAHGRERTVRWGARTLDIDVIAVGAETAADDELLLPHPRAHERAFVLMPWLAVDPAAELPCRGSVRDLLAALPAETRAGVRRAT